MRAIRCHRLDGPDGLALENVTAPAPAEGELTVDVEAAALNFADTLMTRGTYQEKPPLPFTPGLELAGRVRAIGSGVHGFAAGQRVLAVVDHGAFAEVARVRAADAIPLPEAMPAEVAAGFPIAYGTAHGGLEWRARLQPGETLLVNGAAGGVGLTAVEVGRAMGARVIATARGAERLALARAHGAEVTIDTGQADLREAVQAATAGRGVDVVFDPVGGALGEASLRCLAWEGRYLVIGLAAGLPTLKANHLLVKNVSAVGFYWGSYRRHAPDRVQASFEMLFGWWQSGKLRPHVSAVYPLEHVQAALAELEARRSTGKVVLRMS
ncbi:MAG: NADPH:quinone oxidoreductase family protein [Geminicoccaceae bacterium]|nr:MAG: NADPH:quinone oxidoreductase family protein [Geminicoccaceae bacterium]